ncbi:MAG: hypothetical protein GW859_10580 [Sphingomonadales bacterium]|nr:hypothetical protein [Sphingomonadales bacterium]
MRRSGGKSGRPLAHISIDQLEADTRDNMRERDELLIIKNELGFRNSARARELSDLVDRLLRNCEG